VASDLALTMEGHPQYRQPLPDGKWTLVRVRPGESTGNPQHIGVADARVSRQHATIVIWRGKATIIDLRSTDGTFVNGRRIEGRTPLLPGDLITVGDTHFRLVGPPQKEVLILGGGFAGAYCAMELQKLAKRRRDIHISIVSQDNFFLFHPMLPELVSGSIETQHILIPIRRIASGVTLYTGTVENIDLEHRQVTVDLGFENRRETLRFNYLVLALGAITDLSRMPGMREHALLAKTLADAFRVRNHVVDMLEKADAEGDPEERRKLLTFVVAGGGFSGVEVLAELADLVHDALPHYRNIEPGEVRMVLLQGPDRILPEVNESLARFAAKKLAKKGIEVRTNTRIKALTPDEALLASDERIPTHTLIATIGNVPHPLLASLPCQHDQRGAVVTNEYLEVPDCPSVFALGDNASVPDLTTGGRCPPTAQYAIRQARYAAWNVLATINDHPKRPFKFGGLGQLASLGRGSAVAQVFGMKISGFLAWSLWRMVYLSKLPTFQRRLQVTSDWTLDFILPRDIVRLQVEQASSMQRLHFEPGQAVIREGDIGTRFYIVIRGQLEVVRKRSGGEEKLAQLKAGDHFGELALLKQARRAATVRAITSVDLLALNQRDFQALADTGLLHLEGLARATAEKSPTAEDESPTNVPSPKKGTT
jgi:NADH dehydrogenase